MQATELIGFKNHLNEAVWDEIGKKIGRGGPGPGQNFVFCFRPGRNFNLPFGPGSDLNFNFFFGPARA